MAKMEAIKARVARACSGGIYDGVPSTLPACDSLPVAFNPPRTVV